MPHDPVSDPKDNQTRTQQGERQPEPALQPYQPETQHQHPQHGKRNSDGDVEVEERPNRLMEYERMRTWLYLRMRELREGWLPVILSGLALAIVFYQTIITRRQLESTEKAVEAADKSYILARESVTRVERPHAGVVEQRIVTLEYGKPIVVELTLANEGSTTATVVRLIKVGHKWGLDGELPRPRGALDTSIMTGSILPHRNITANINVPMDYPMDAGEFEAFKNGRSRVRFMVFGVGEYSGPSSDKEGFIFCGFYVPGSLKLVSCEGYYHPGD